MFKVNLYTEREEKRQRARKQAMTTAAISGILGVNAVLVGSLILGATLLEDRRHTLGEEVTRLQAIADQTGTKAPGLELTRELFQLRQERVEWSPLLASIAENIPSSLLLDAVQGQTTHGRVQSHFDMSGVGRGGTVAMADVSGFVNHLRDDPRVNKAFPDVSLGSVRSETGEFQVVCEQPVGK
jgi:hypothetical protein